MTRGFPADVGDVISLGQTELWLEGGWLLSEAEPIAAICFAREAAVVLLPQPSEECHLLEEIALDGSGDPPPTLEIGSERYQRTRRRPVSIEALGSAPLPFAEGLLGEYEGIAGSVLFLLAGKEAWRTWKGLRVSTTELDRWGPGNGGSPTLP
jgi:hypothetical protein